MLCCTRSPTICKDRHITLDTLKQQPQHHQPPRICGIRPERACCWGRPREGRHGHAQATTCAIKAHQCAGVKNKGWHKRNTLVCGLSAALQRSLAEHRGKSNRLGGNRNNKLQARSCKRVGEAAACGSALRSTHTAAHAATGYRRNWGPCHKVRRQPNTITHDRGRNTRCDMGAMSKLRHTVPSTTLLVCELA